MNIEKTHIPGLLVIEPKIFSDERGFFMETYNALNYQKIGLVENFVQDNLSQSKKGVLRGLHYQAPPFAQGKLVTVLRGAVLDVVVDIRFGSPTFGQHIAIELTAENKKQLWIPPGFAHGFVALEDDTLFSYKCTNVYAPEHERGIRFDDPALRIAWPIFEQFLLSPKDEKFPYLADIPKEFTYSS